MESASLPDSLSTQILPPISSQKPRGNGQAQTGTTIFPGCGPVDLFKGTEDHFLFLFGNPYSGIAHQEMDYRLPANLRNRR